MRVRWKAKGILLAAAVAAACVPGGAPGEPRRPNGLLLVLDTTRLDRLSTHGYELPTSPALDRLAAEGMTYDRCVSAGSWTLPSHASIFTGLYPKDHGTTIENWNLAPEHTTLAEVLRAEGYATAGFCCNPWVGDRYGLTQGFERRAK